MPATTERPQTNGAKPLPTTYSPPRRRSRSSEDNSGYWAAFSLLLGMLVARTAGPVAFGGLPCRVDLGQVGLLNVGGVHGTMSH